MEKERPPSSARELLERYAAGERNFDRAKLRDAHFGHEELSGVRLAGADLTSADLRNANLHGAELSNAVLLGANFVGACLVGATLTRVDAAVATFERADLSRAILASANMDRAVLCGARLVSSGLQKADLQYADLRRADLTGAMLGWSSLRFAALSSARLNSTSFRNADLTGADLRGADMRHADLVRATLSGATLGGADLGAAVAGETTLSDLDIVPLVEACPEMIHVGPSGIEWRTIVRSLRSPRLKDFLQAAGAPAVFAEYMVECARAVGTSVFDLFKSTFISYGAPDEQFASRLHAALHRNGVDTFFFPVHAEPGSRVGRSVRTGLEEKDKMILVCSRASLERPGVLYEIELALDREAHGEDGERIIPVLLDDYLFTDWSRLRPDLAKALKRRVAADFRGAVHDQQKFDVGVRRLVAALKKK